MLQREIFYFGNLNRAIREGKKKIRDPSERKPHRHRHRANGRGSRHADALPPQPRDSPPPNLPKRRLSSFFPSNVASEIINRACAAPDHGARGQSSRRGLLLLRRLAPAPAGPSPAPPPRPPPPPRSPGGCRGRRDRRRAGEF